MVLFALTELVAEIAVWTLKKTATYSWRGLWWGVSKYRGTTPAEENSETQLHERLKELQLKLEHQEREIAELKK